MTGARRAGWVAALAALLVALVAAPAEAAFNSTTSASSATATFSTLQVAAPTGVTATASCGPVGSLSAKVALTWVASTTSRVTAYGIERRIAPAPATEVATTGASATSYSDSGLAVATTYSYVIRAYVGSWYAGSVEVSATTPAICT